jgi:intracellular sulfur oxidation DsrE/DsrF family protein
VKTSNLLLVLLAAAALPVTVGATPATGAAAASAAIASPAPAPKVVFQINVAEDAPTILRFVTNYLIAEPTARVAVVSYGPGIDFMLKDAKDPKGVPYEPQLAMLKAKGVDFKVCDNTLKARNATAEIVSKEATVVPGAVNEILRLQTREGYAYFQH